MSAYDEITPSVIGALAEQFNGDQKAVDHYLKSVKESADAHIQDKKIQELEASFPTIARADVIRVLKANDWNVDACYVPLFDVTEQATRKEAEQRKEREEKKKREAAEKQAKQLMLAFNQIPQATVLKLLQENHDDIEETANALCKVVEEQEAKKKSKSEKAEMRDDFLEIQMRVLVDKFPEFSYEELLDALKKNKGDLQQSVKSLLNLIEEQKKIDLQRAFPTFTLAEIEGALEKTKGRDKMEAAKYLTEQKSKQEAPIQAHPPVELKESKVFRPSILPKIQEDITQQSIIIASTAPGKLQEEDKLKAREIFKDKLEVIISAQAIEKIGNINVIPDSKPPLMLAEIDELLKNNVSVQALPAPVESSINPSDAKAEIDFVVLLKASPAQIDIGSNFTVEFEVANGKSSASDWIGIFNVSSLNKEYLTYQWRGKDETKGKLTFAAPVEYGEYEFRYFCNKTYSHIAVSNRVKVGPEIKLDAKLSQDSKNLHLKWTQNSGNTYTRSWVGLFNKQQLNNKAYLAFDYANKMDLIFETPVKPGEYEFRFFTNSYVDVAKSNTIRIEGEDKLTAAYKEGCVFVDLDVVSVDARDKAWVGLYFVSEVSHKRFRRYQALKDNKSTLKFNSPKTAGTYEARLFTNGTYDFVIKSAPFEIPNGH